MCGLIVYAHIIDYNRRILPDHQNLLERDHTHLQSVYSVEAWALMCISA